jgi:fructose-bisphosphate aldolase, class I
MDVYPRLKRFFSADGRCFDVAVDHGFFNEPAFLNGIENMQQVISTLVEANPDAIQLTVGMAPLLQSIPGKSKPALVLRVDTANVYGKQLPAHLYSRMIGNTVEQALRLDAACLCVNLLQVPEPDGRGYNADLHAQCIDNITRLKPECERYGLPLMVEPLIFRPNQEAGGYEADGDILKIIALVRQAVELGADVVKADPCDDVREYKRVIEVASGCPILVRGGSKASEKELVQRTVELMHQGAAGIVYGRNIIQHPSPAKMVRALMAIVHDRIDDEQAEIFMS